VTTGYCRHPQGHPHKARLGYIRHSPQDGTVHNTQAGLNKTPNPNRAFTP